MSVENVNVIDLASIDTNENVVLTISDHLEWDMGNEHLLILQNKINNYLAAIEGGDFYENYPKGKGRPILINIVAKYPPSRDGKVFLERTEDILKSAGYGFSFSVVAPSGPNL